MKDREISTVQKKEPTRDGPNLGECYGGIALFIVLITSVLLARLFALLSQRLLRKTVTKIFVGLNL